MIHRAWPLLLAIAISSGCRVPQPSGFDAARARIARGDLVGALVLLDRVPPADPDYGEARSLASAVERRLRTSQRLFARGLSLRAQWRDEEAVEAFELARGVWPGLDGVDALIAATRLRARALGAPAEPAAVSDPAGAVATTAPIVASGPSEGASEDGVALVAAEPLAAPAGETAAPDAPDGAVPSGPQEAPAPPDAQDADRGADDAILRARLGQARAQLRGGRLDEALALLHELHARSPGRRDVAELRVRVLHQRALLHYGQGELSHAVEAWELLLASEPGHAQAREFRDAARSELDALRRR